LQNPLATASPAVDSALSQRNQDVARRSKINPEKHANGHRSEPTARGLSSGALSESKPAGGAVKSRAKKAASKKKTTPESTPVTPAGVAPAGTYEPTDEEIRIRAYFIAERRLQLSLQGDSDHDWLEAKRQLVEEASRAAS